MYGPYHIITYLQKLNKTDFNLVLEYSVWVIEHYPEESLEVNIYYIYIFTYYFYYLNIYYYIYKLINN